MNRTWRSAVSLIALAACLAGRPARAGDCDPWSNFGPGSIPCPAPECCESRPVGGGCSTSPSMECCQHLGLAFEWLHLRRDQPERVFLASEANLLTGVTTREFSTGDA